MSKGKFFITTTHSKDPHQRGRCVGYVNTLKEAIEVATRNPEFYSEAGFYDLVVIEEIGPGIYSYCSPEKQIWYKFVDIGGKLVAKKIPNPYKSTVGWAIG